MTSERALPPIGSLVRKDYGAKNINTWGNWGEVRAIVDDVIVIRRLMPGTDGEPCWRYDVIDPYEWRLMPWKVKAKERKP